MPSLDSNCRCASYAYEAATGRPTLDPRIPCPLPITKLQKCRFVRRRGDADVGFDLVSRRGSLGGDRPKPTIVAKRKSCARTSFRERASRSGARSAPAEGERSAPRAEAVPHEVPQQMRRIIEVGLALQPAPHLIERIRRHERDVGREQRRRTVTLA